MKNLKKFAALLLAGAMALLMLTACGGGGGDFGKRDPDAEDKAFNRFTSTAQASGLKENDKSLQAVAEGHLREDLNSSIEILGAKLVGKVHVEGEEKEYLTITVTGRYDYGFIVAKILNDIQNAIGKEFPGTKVDVKGKVMAAGPRSAWSSGLTAPTATWQWHSRFGTPTTSKQ